MGMTPDDFFEVFVQGNYEDYLSNIGGIRQAFNAAISASHMADQYLTYYKKHDPSKVKSFNRIGDFVEYLSSNTNDCFRDIRSISNAYKHLYTSDDPKTAVHWTISSPGAIESISFLDKKSEIKEIIEESMVDSDYIKSKVVYTRKDGQKFDFLPTLETVIKFLGEILYHPDRLK